MSRVGLSVSWMLLLSPAAALAQDASVIKAHADHLKQGDSKAAGELVKFGAAAVPALIDVLKEGDGFAKSHAAQALGRIGPAAKKAVAPLAMVLNGEEAALASQAGLALGQIGPAAVPVLMDVLKNPRTDLARARGAQ